MATEPVPDSAIVVVLVNVLTRGSNNLCSSHHSCIFFLNTGSSFVAQALKYMLHGPLSPESKQRNRRSSSGFAVGAPQTASSTDTQHFVGVDSGLRSGYCGVRISFLALLVATYADSAASNSGTLRLPDSIGAAFTASVFHEPGVETDYACYPPDSATSCSQTVLSQPLAIWARPTCWVRRFFSPGLLQRSTQTRFLELWWFSSCTQL